MIQNKNEKDKLVYMTLLRDIKVTLASKSTPQKTNRGQMKMARQFGSVNRHQTGADSESDLKAPEPESAMLVSL